MNESLYEVAFFGQIQEGAELDAVKARISKMFKADEATMTNLFSGKRIVIRKNLSAEAADRYSVAFTKAGAICDLTLMPAATAPPVPAEDRAATKAPSSASAAPAGRGTSSNQSYSRRGCGYTCRRNALRYRYIGRAKVPGWNGNLSRCRSAAIGGFCRQE